ncbi:UPF0488 protein C8orf33 homolog [Procambarus clarkii]|uniref:UPF0488 protein C8orf33 homolog n=1 Tax=Procambarus clarkii TaxID=6728 RepID=UPI001E677C45|nr:UPF0488 protein C8orf33 homolog [Procambarus clarkii]
MLIVSQLISRVNDVQLSSSVNDVQLSSRVNGVLLSIGVDGVQLSSGVEGGSYKKMPPKRQVKKGLEPKVKVKNAPVVEENEDTALERFSLELRWCIQQIELSMAKNKPSSKQADDMKKAYSTLTSSKASLIKKRQTMNALFGDYRKKMAEEENKFRIEQPKLKSKCVLPSNSVFFKKSHGQTCNHNSQDKISVSSTEAYIPNNSVGDIQQSQVGVETNCSSALDKHSEESCVQDCNENKMNNDKDNTVLNSFKYAPSGNSFKFNF